MTNKTNSRPAAPAEQAAGTTRQQRPRRTVGQRMAANRKQLERNLLRLLVFCTVLLFFLNLVIRDRDYSYTENRSLASFPHMSLSAITDGSWFKGLNDWYNDQFFIRDKWISLHLQELKLFGQKEAGGVYLGKGGYLMMKPETPNETTMSNTIAAINDFTAANPDLRATMLVIPDSATTMRDKLPANAPARDQNADIRAFEAQLDPAITCVDAGEVLARHTEEYIYYQTDHHWTSLGAFYTFEAAIDALNIRDSVTEFEVFTVTDSFRGTLCSKSGSRKLKDRIDIYLPKSDIRYSVARGDNAERNCSIYNSEALGAGDQYTVFFGGNYSKVEIQTTANNGRVLLVFKDSYANSFIQFLLPCYERIIMVDPRYFYGSLDALLGEGVTDVLYLYAGDTIVASGALTDVLRSAIPPAGDPVPSDSAPAGAIPADAPDAPDTPDAVDAPDAPPAQDGTPADTADGTAVPDSTVSDADTTDGRSETAG